MFGNPACCQTHVNVSKIMHSLASPVCARPCCDKLTQTRFDRISLLGRGTGGKLTIRDMNLIVRGRQQVGRGSTAPRGLALPGRSPWQGRRFARPLHPTRAGGLSPPPCTPTAKGLPWTRLVPYARMRRSGFRARHHDQNPAPVPATFAQPCADWMRGQTVRRLGHHASAVPRWTGNQRALLLRYLQRQAFAPGTTTKGVPPLDTRPSLRRLDWRQRAPLDPA